MSADNWAVCPVCNPGGSTEEKECDNTLREDYEQGMQSDGEYYCIYHCRCQSCKFEWKHEYRQKVVDFEAVKRATTTRKVTAMSNNKQTVDYKFEPVKGRPGAICDLGNEMFISYNPHPCAGIGQWEGGPETALCIRSEGYPRYVVVSGDHSDECLAALRAGGMEQLVELFEKLQESHPCSFNDFEPGQLTEVWRATTT